jgi:signal transduction histidine kinase
VEAGLVLVRDEFGATGHYGRGVQATARRLRARDWFRDHPLAADAVLAAAAYLLTAAFTLLAGNVDPTLGYGWFELLQMAAGMTPIILRRKSLWGAIGLMWLMMGLNVFTPLDAVGTDGGIALVILTYTIAAHRGLGPALGAMAALWVPTFAWAFHVYVAVQGLDMTMVALLMATNVASMVTAFFIGWVMRNRRLRLVELTERARIAEANQEALADQAVVDERRRIARELHDVVAHHVSVIGVMAEGARRVLRTDPDAAEEALETVTDTARTALQEMRGILTVLRTEDTGAADLTPQPTLESLRALVAQTREAGLPVRYTVHGREYPLPTGVGLAAYRIVQEALTNTLKHAGPRARAGVVVDYGDDEFGVTIGDSGKGAPVAKGYSGGHGLIGMRERAHLYGGTLTVGPRPGGGYLVEARFPRRGAYTAAAAPRTEEARG